MACDDIFSRLGGIRKMAEILGEAPSTVQSWKKAGRIPSAKQPLVIDRARAAGFPITAIDVVFPLACPTVCDLCDRRASDPTVNDCTAVNCGLRQREAA